MRDAGARSPRRPHALRPVGDRRLRRRAATSTTSPCAASSSTTASTSAATACRSTPRPRSRSTTRRASTCCKGLSGIAGRHERAGRPGRPGRQASARRAADARRSCEWRERGSVARRGRPEPALRRRRRLRPAPERWRPSTSIRSCATQRGSRNWSRSPATGALGAATLVEAEIEQQPSRRSRSVPGFSLLGDRVPAVPDPRINLNDQPWSLPVVFDATTASLRVTQKLGDDWRIVAHGVTQRLRTDDRIAFPFGCTAADGTYYADRYCPDGTFDLYDFRSENERRRSDALDVSLHGRVRHRPARAHARDRRAAQRRAQPLQRRGLQLRGHRQRRRHARHAAGARRRPTRTPTATSDRASSTCATRSPSAPARRSGSAPATARSTAPPTPPTAARRRAIASRSRRPFAAVSADARDRSAGLRELGREASRPTSRPTCRCTPTHGQALPAATSRQTELGLKGNGDALDWTLAAFDIRRPLFGDLPACGDTDASCTPCAARQPAAIAASRRAAPGAQGAWELRGGAQWLHARVDGTGDPDARRQAPDQRAGAQRPARRALRGGRGDRPGARRPAPATRARAKCCPTTASPIPSVTRFDLGARYERRAARRHAGRCAPAVDNLFDRRAWRESPYQYSHAYLFPLEPRTFRVSLQADL